MNRLMNPWGLLTLMLGIAFVGVLVVPAINGAQATQLALLGLLFCGSLCCSLVLGTITDPRRLLDRPGVAMRARGQVTVEAALVITTFMGVILLLWFIVWSAFINWQVAQSVTSLGHSLTTSAAYDAEDFSKQAQAWGFDSAHDAFKIIVVPADGSTPAVTYDWGETPLIGYGDLITVRVGKTVQDSSMAQLLDSIGFPNLVAGSWIGVAQRNGS